MLSAVACARRILKRLDPLNIVVVVVQLFVSSTFRVGFVRVDFSAGSVLVVSVMLSQAAKPHAHHNFLLPLPYILASTVFLSIRQS